MQRCVEPELLDTLPAEDREAKRSRRELRVINNIMGNHRWIAREIAAAYQPGWRVLELGAGDGWLGTELVKKRIVPTSALTGLDLQGAPEHWPGGAAWRQQSVLGPESLPPAEIVCANLFLHHFEPDALRAIAAALPRECRVLLCSEPARRGLHLAQGSLLSAIANFGYVTRNDMAISIRAGFLGMELPYALGLSGHEGWDCEASVTFLGAYRMKATHA